MKGFTWLDLDGKGTEASLATRGGELQKPANRVFQ